MMTPEEFSLKLKRSQSIIYGTKICGLIDEIVAKHNELYAKYGDDVNNLTDIAEILRNHNLPYFGGIGTWCGFSDMESLPADTPFSKIFGEPMKMWFGLEQITFTHYECCHLYVSNKYGGIYFGKNEITIKAFESKDSALQFSLEFFYRGANQFWSEYYLEVAVRQVNRALHIFERDFPAFRDRYMADAESFTKP